MVKQQGLGKFQKDLRTKTETKILNYLEIMEPAYVRQIIRHLRMDSHAIVNALRRLENKNILGVTKNKSDINNSPKYYFRKQIISKNENPKLSAKTLPYTEPDPKVFAYWKLEHEYSFTLSLEIYKLGYSPPEDFTLIYFKYLEKSNELDTNIIQIGRISVQSKKISVSRLAEKISMSQNIINEILKCGNDYLEYHHKSLTFFEKFVKEKGYYKKHKKLIVKYKNLLNLIS